MLLELRSDFTLNLGYLNPALNYPAKVISPPSLFSGMAKASGSLVRNKNNKDKTEMEKNGREHTCRGNRLSKFKKNNNNRNSFTKGWFTK